MPFRQVIMMYPFEFNDILKCGFVYTVVNLGSIVAVEDSVEHLLRVAAVRVEFGTQSLRIGNDARVFARNGTRFLRVHVDSCDATNHEIVLLDKHRRKIEKCTHTNGGMKWNK